MMMNDDGDAGGDVDSLAFFSPKRSLFQGWRLGDRQNHKRLCFHTQVLHTEAFTHKSIYTEKSLHKVTLHIRDFTHRSFYTKKLLHREVFTHRSFYTEKSLHRAAAKKIRISPHACASDTHDLRRGLLQHKPCKFALETHDPRKGWRFL